MPPEFGFHLVQLRLQPLAHRLPPHREHSVAPLLPADMREAEEVERFWFPFSAPLPVRGRERPEFQKARLLGMQFERELPKPLRQLRPELFGIGFHLESQYDVIRKPHDDHLAAGSLPMPSLDPLSALSPAVRRDEHKGFWLGLRR
jgi:hypothetical protein